ncbi:hypothetical protein JW960_29185 [candidate division KSB1 bacterium]|nr:hypothetical protein [candidate division KSB1 bacterium]
MAIFIWFFVKTENNYKYAFRIPIQVSNLPNGKIITNDIPKQAKVTFWGKGRELLTLILNRKLYYNLDLVNIDDSQVFIPNIHNIRLPHESTIEILNILEPDSIYVEIADLEMRAIPVLPQISIETVSGYTIVNGVKLSQDSVHVVGPKKQLDSLKYIETEKLHFKNKKHDINKEVELVTPKIKYIKLLENSISFTVDIQKLMEKRLVEIPVEVINKPPNYSVTVIPSSLSLTLIGGVDVLLPLESKDIKAYIDYTKVYGSKNKEHLAYIEKINGVRFTDIKPKGFKIVVKKIR